MVTRTQAGIDGWPHSVRMRDLLRRDMVFQHDVSGAIRCATRWRV